MVRVSFHQRSIDVVTNSSAHGASVEYVMTETGTLQTSTLLGDFGFLVRTQSGLWNIVKVFVVRMLSNVIKVDKVTNDPVE
jgi:hypothetical protein